MSVELHHPNLPDTSITVHEDAVPVHEQAGWVRAETSPAEPVNHEQPAPGSLDLSEQEN